MKQQLFAVSFDIVFGFRYHTFKRRFFSVKLRSAFRENFLRVDTAFQQIVGFADLPCNGLKLRGQTRKPVRVYIVC